VAELERAATECRLVADDGLDTVLATVRGGMRDGAL